MQKQTNFAMAQNNINAFVSTTSGVCGGIGKVVTGNILLNTITFQSIGEVSLYALISAVIGYGVKLSIDTLVKPKNKKRHE